MTHSTWATTLRDRSFSTCGICRLASHGGFRCIVSMVHTFATREDAAIFASAMRSDDYSAEILDEHMGALYGPLAIGGIRVVVSDTPTDEMETAAGEPGKTEDGEFLRTLRLFVVGIAGFGLAVVAIMLISHYSRHPGGLAWVVLRVLKYPLCIALAYAVMAPLMPGFTRWLRGEQLSVGASWLRWLMLALLVPFLMLAAL